MRVGIFGGSFDPVHLAHLQLAHFCRRQARLDRVEFVPAARQPHKPQGPAASDEDRLAMLRLAVAGVDSFHVSTEEIERPGPSYTADTLRQMRQRQPGDQLFFMMGADSLADFPNWREPEAICELATLLVVRREGAAEPNLELLRTLASPGRLQEIRATQVKMPATPISSSQIRRLVAEDGPWRSLVPESVAAYIDARGLYRN